jgi:probable HAF family extracellular repeat protein
VKLPFPRSFKAWLVASVSLIAFTVVSVAPMIRPRAQSLPANYTFTDLGTLGGTYSKAYGINNCGQVVGESSLTGVSPTHPFIWRNSVMSDLGTLGGVRGLAMDINASGMVVGFSTIATDEQRAFRWFDLDGDSVPDPGEMNDLGALPNHFTHGAYGVNDNGQIVGSAENGLGEASGFRWNANTGLQLLDTLNGIAPSYGYAINNSSHIAGYAAPIDHAFIFNGTTNIDLGSFGGTRSIAYDINASGHAVGFADVTMGGSTPPTRAFKWTGTALQNLGVLASGTRSVAYGINASGVIVGSSEINVAVPPKSHAFVYDGTNQMYDLNTLVADLPTDWTLVEAHGINDGGQIVGWGTTPLGETHAFLLTPTTFTPTCSPTVTVTVSSPDSVSEDGATNLTYTFTRAPVTSTPMTVNFSTGGTATRAVDYAVSGTGITYDPNTGSGTVAFAAGEITKNVTVDPATDSDVEPNETVVLATTTGAGYIVGSPTSAAGTINNDDSIPGVSVSVAPTAAHEDGATNLVYTFTRSTTTTSPLIVGFATTGTAVANDYSISHTSNVTIPANTASATVTVTPIADTTDEPDETVILTVTPDASYTVGTAETGTITDDDATPMIQITNVTAPEPSPGPTSFVFTVSLTNPSSSQITVDYVTDTTGATATAGASCSGGVDFVSVASSGLTFSAGETSKQVSVTVCGDNTLEPDETFSVNLSGNSANSVLPTNLKGTGTITPQVPVVYVEQGTALNPIPTAAAVDSVTFARGPFRLVNNLNFSEDRLTRVILVTSNLGMTQADLATGILTVNVAGYATPLPIEHVGTITGLDASFIIVRLPADLNPAPGPNNLTLTVKMGSATSNATILSITP